MKRFTSNKKIIYVFGIILFLLLWQVIAMIVGERVLIFPGPIETFKYAIELLGKSYVWECIGTSLGRMFLGFGISFIFALLLGIMAGNHQEIEELLKPLMTVLKSVPTACLVFLFLIIVGARIAPIFIVMLISFPILYEGVVGGIKSVPEKVIDASKLDGASILQRTFYISLPLAVPYILVSLASSFSLSFKIEIMAEIITGDTRTGLGSAILASQKNDPSNMVPIFAYSLIAISLMLIFNNIASFIKKKLIITQ